MMNFSARQLLAILTLHLLPLLPLAFGRIYLTVAAVLFVLTFYIKSLKLSAQMEQLQNDQEEYKGTKTLRDRWRWFTFLHS